MRVLTFLVLSAIAAPAFAQSASDSGIPEGCTYGTCALRAEATLFGGLEIVKGERGESVTRQGFLGGVDLRSVVAESPDALEHANRYHAARTQSLVGLGASLGLILVASYALAEDQQELALASYIGSLGASFYGTSQALASQRELERALWDYNGEFAR